jgi:KaiC/GvpD/RAD55 family RecA-like ATPase
VVGRIDLDGLLEFFDGLIKFACREGGIALQRTNTVYVTLMR